MNGAGVHLEAEGSAVWDSSWENSQTALQLLGTENGKAREGVVGVQFICEVSGGTRLILSALDD